MTYSFTVKAKIRSSENGPIQSRIYFRVNECEIVVLKDEKFYGRQKLYFLRKKLQTPEIHHNEITISVATQCQKYELIQLLLECKDRNGRSKKTKPVLFKANGTRQ
ncbi:hypothetical protein BTVI_90877 [Pitangus sulphuratus]|nr:hypothetical protein BTVI_90877 [Pitangus sulphuratus]